MQFGNSKFCHSLMVRCCLQGKLYNDVIRSYLLCAQITRVENLRLPDGSGGIAAAASPSLSSVHPPAGRGRGRPITGNSSAAGDGAGASGFTASGPRVAPFPAAAAAAATVVAAASAAAASASSPGPSVDDDDPGRYGSISN